MKRGNNQHYRLFPLFTLQVKTLNIALGRAWVWPGAPAISFEEPRQIWGPDRVTSEHETATIQMGLYVKNLAWIAHSTSDFQAIEPMGCIAFRSFIMGNLQAYE